LYVNIQNGSFRAQANIDWFVYNLDTYGDAEDLASIGGNQNISISGTYGTVYNINGAVSGNANNGTWSFGSTITDGATTANGHIWNIIDKNPGNATSYVLTIYFTASQATDLYTSYAHNYKDLQSQPTASIGFSGLTPSGQLSLSYSYVNRSWGPIFGPKMSTTNPS
jgi:hypothetical protein